LTFRPQSCFPGYYVSTELVVVTVCWLENIGSTGETDGRTPDGQGVTTSWRPVVGCRLMVLTS